jgi:carbonic anhydrase/acetyltransferase-like protein (isoleucine patch superfamily)
MNHFSKADSASLIGTIHVGKNARIAQGAVVRSLFDNVTIENESIVLENCVVLGAQDMHASIGRKVVFGHRVIFIGAEMDDLCEIGNNSIIMPGAKIGSWCIFGEGTLISEGMLVPDRSVVVGRPGRVIRSLTPEDESRIKRMRGGNIVPSDEEPKTISSFLNEEISMGKLYIYKEKMPQIGRTSYLFESAEITGDVVIGEDCIIGAGVKIIGDTHGPVRIGNSVQILENTVLHLLPDNELIIEDNVIIGPGCMIHGCKIRAGTIVEPGAIVCDYSQLGRNCLVKAGSLVKQRSHFPDLAILEGFPAKQVKTNSEPLTAPKWIFTHESLQSLFRHQATQ